LLEEKTIYKGKERSTYKLWKNSRAFYTQKLTILQKVKFPIYYVIFYSSRTFSGTYRAHRAHRAQCAQAVVEHSVELESQLPILE